MIILLSLMLVLFVATTVILSYVAYNSQNKIDIYEGWIVEFKNDISDVYRQMKIIDDRQIFEKDDEVGSTFSQLYFIIQKLNQRTESNVKSQQQQQEEEEES
jgi:predicted PurR-regulated permease PerM